MAREATPGGLDLLVLHLLSEREMYGYEIVTELANRSNAVAVTAYEEKKEGRTRRYYRLTRRGRGRLRQQEEEWQSYAAAVNAVLCSPA